MRLGGVVVAFAIGWLGCVNAGDDDVARPVYDFEGGVPKTPTLSDAGAPIVPVGVDAGASRPDGAASLDAAAADAAARDASSGDARRDGGAAQDGRGDGGACDLLLQNCPADEGCYPVAGGATACLRSELEAGEGLPCTTYESCLPGLICVQTICTRLCNTTAPLCGGRATCSPLGGGYAPAGYCVP